MRDSTLMGEFQKINKALTVLASDTTKNNMVLNALVLYLSHRRSFECKWKWVEMIRGWVSNRMGLIDMATLKQFVSAQIKQNQLQTIAQAKAHAEAEKIKKQGNPPTKPERKPEPQKNG